MTDLIVEVSKPGEDAQELVQITRVINTRELTGLDLELEGDIQYFEVTRFTRKDGALRQWHETTYVHIDPTDPDAMIRLAYVALEMVHEGESRDDAWLSATREADDEIEEVVTQKDEFIGQQSHIITELMAILSTANAWKHVPAELYEELRNYV